MKPCPPCPRCGHKCSKDHAWKAPPGFSVDKAHAHVAVEPRLGIVGHKWDDKGKSNLLQTHEKASNIKENSSTSSPKLKE